MTSRCSSVYSTPVSRVVSQVNHLCMHSSFNPCPPPVVKKSLMRTRRSSSVPPVVEPFSFPSDLVVGRRAGVACVVSAGDLPIHIKWLKDGSALDVESLGAKLVTADFTSSLSFARMTRDHRGNYSCVAENPASSVSYSTQMLVQGKCLSVMHANHLT